jgi:two-component system NarL family sensor kinase
MPQNWVILELFTVAILYAGILIGFVAVIIPHINQTRALAFENRITDVRQKYDQELLRSRLEIQEETLDNLGRELHDNIGQKIYFSRLILTEIISTGNIPVDRLTLIDSTLQEAADDLHGLLKNRSMDLIMKGDLRRAIEGLVGKLEKSKVYKISFSHEGIYECLADEEEIFVFRIFQESINNILRHSWAENIQILFQCTPKWVRLSIKDDGCGFDVEEANSFQTSHRPVAGLINMRERARLIKADIIIESTLGVGTQVSLTVPIKSGHRD